MISPHTPPGTRLVVVWDAPWPEALRVVKPEYRWMCSHAALSGRIAMGDSLVLASIEPCELAVDDFAARVHNVDGLWSLECFDVAALPDCLVRLQETLPNRVPEDATC